MESTAKKMDKSAILMEQAGQGLDANGGPSSETVIVLTIICLCLLLLGVIILCALCKRR